MMLLLLVCIIVGAVAGYFLDIPWGMVNVKFLGLLFMALLDSFTYALVRDLGGYRSNNGPVFIRLVLGLVLGAFIIYFGEKSELDLYLVALVPLAVGFSLNLYKFLPK
jgi:hypothetical protein